MEHDDSFLANSFNSISTLFVCRQGVLKLFSDILQLKERSFFMGFRRVSNSTNELTSLSFLFPLPPRPMAGYFVYLSGDNDAFLYATFNAVVFDYILRNSLSQPSIPQSTFEQVAVPSPEIFTSRDRSFSVGRVLELTYTAWDMRPFAKDLGYEGEPFRWDPERQAELRAELDAYYAYLYGLSKRELRYILNPKDVMGEDYPSETFRVLKDNEIREYGEYRTKRLVLEAYDRFAKDGTFDPARLEDPEYFPAMRAALAVSKSREQEILHGRGGETAKEATPAGAAPPP